MCVFVESPLFDCNLLWLFQWAEWPRTDRSIAGQSPLWSLPFMIWPLESLHIRIWRATSSDTVTFSSTGNTMRPVRCQTQSSRIGERTSWEANNSTIDIRWRPGGKTLPLNIFLKYIRRIYNNKQHRKEFSLWIYFEGITLRCFFVSVFCMKIRLSDASDAASSEEASSVVFSLSPRSGQHLRSSLQSSLLTHLVQGNPRASFICGNIQIYS